MTDSLRRRLMLLAAVGLIGLPLSLTIFASSNDYKPVRQSGELDNANLLRDWVPRDIYDFTMKRVGAYMDKNNKTVSAMHINNDGVFLQDDGTIEFTVDTRPTGEDFTIDIKTASYSGILSTSVYINGQLQRYAPASEAGGTTYQNFDALLATGLSSVQVNSLQTQLHRFIPGASPIAINAGSIKQHKESDGSYAIAFTVTMSGDSYRGRLLYRGLTDIHVLLQDKNQKDVFDSGLVKESAAP